MFKRYSGPELLEMIKRDLEPSHALVFDCDGTLIDGDVSTLTGWHLMKDGLVDMELIPDGYRDTHFHLKMNLLDYDRVRKEVERLRGAFYTLEWELLIQSGLPHELVVDYAHRAIDFGFQEALVTYTSTMPSFIRDHASQSWVVSGSSYPTVAALAEKLGVSSGRVLATRLELVDGIYQPQFSAPGFVWEANKVKALQSAGVETPYFVAGDSPGDWHMMDKSSDWVWCMMWKNNHFGAKNFREFLKEKLPFGQEIPHEAGFYVTTWQRKHWVFEVM